MKLRTSQKALLSAVGVVFVATLLWLVIVSYIARSAVADSSETSRTPAPMETVTRSDLAGFSRVRAQNGWDLILTQGNDWQVEIGYPEGMADRIDVELRNDTLELNYRTPRGFRLMGFGSPGRGTATITMPALDRAAMEGAGSLTLAGFEGERLELSGAGAYTVTAEDSRFTTLELSLTGAGAADLRGLTAVNANVSITGATDTKLTMEGGTLTGSVSGAGQFEYFGPVRDANLSRAGAIVVRRWE